MKQYFPLDIVVEETLGLYQELLGLVFKEVPQGTFSCWHESVRLFAVFYESSQELVRPHLCSEKKVNGCRWVTSTLTSSREMVCSVGAYES